MTQENELLNQPEIIKVIGEQGEEIFMKLQEIVNVNNQDYALLSVVEDDKLPVDDSVDDEIIIMKMIKTDDECSFEIIETDEEFDMVAKAITDDEDDEYEDDEEE